MTLGTCLSSSVITQRHKMKTLYISLWNQLRISSNDVSQPCTVNITIKKGGYPTPIRIGNFSSFPCVLHGPPHLTLDLRASTPWAKRYTHDGRYPGQAPNKTPPDYVTDTRQYSLSNVCRIALINEHAGTVQVVGALQVIWHEDCVLGSEIDVGTSGMGHGLHF